MLGKKTLVGITSFIFIITSSFNSFSQSIWTGTNDGSYISLEFLKPSFNSFFNLNIQEPSFSTFLSGKIKISKSIHAVAEVPVFRAEVEEPEGGIQFVNPPNLSETRLGNPYLGIQYRNGDSKFFYEFGVRPLLFSNNSGFSGLLGSHADPYRGASGSNSVSEAIFRINYSINLNEHSFVRARIGPSLLNDKWNGLSAELETNVQIGQQNEFLSYMLGLSHHTSLNGIHFDASIWRSFGSWQPGLQIRVPISEGDVVVSTSHILGVSLRYYIKS